MAASWRGQADWPGERGGGGRKVGGRGGDRGEELITDLDRGKCVFADVCDVLIS